ncbi:MAG TPA: RHS repeat-associated core domain-containing protein, partial [Vicinamibacterales bacterium]|nr:RHS repeat-associated core domain-containing protein [Vicinamibacterales bacterium]
RTDVDDTTRYTYYLTDASDCAQSPATCRYRRGDVRSVRNALGHETMYLAYDGAGRVIESRDPNGVVTTLGYDRRGRLQTRSLRAPDGSTETTRFDYHPTGLLAQITQPDGVFTRFEYDAAQRLTAIEDGLGNRIEYTLDATGNRVKEQVKDRGGRLVRAVGRVYDTLGRLQQLKDAAGAKLVDYRYDANGHLDETTDGRGRITDYQRDALDRLIRQIDNTAGVGSERAEVGYGYDAADRLRRVVDPRGLGTDYAYDGLDNLIQLSSPDTGATSFEHDAAGNLVRRTDARGNVLVQTFDALGRLSTQRFGNAPTITYTYDEGTYGIGRLTTLSDGSSTTRWAYDAFGRVVEKTQRLRDRSWTVRYGYASGGRLARITYPSGKTIRYEHDAAGNIRSISIDDVPLMTAVGHEPFGPANGWTWGNGTSHRRAYDADGRLKALELPREPVDLQVYDYDGLNRLTAADVSGVRLRYMYDATGNRTEEWRNGVLSGYTIDPASNRLLGISGRVNRSFQYDAVGALINDSGNSYRYDARQRLIEARGNVYTINGLGQRIEKAGSGAATASGVRQFVYDEAGHLIGEYDPISGQALAEHVYLGDWPVGLLQGGAIHFVYPDHLGTPRTIVRGSDGAVVWNWRKEPFGEGAIRAAAGFVYQLRMPGQYFDAETGLYYNYFRDYDPSTGRYIESDPIGLEGGPNTYGYALGNPLAYSDPSGLFVDTTGQFLQTCAQTTVSVGLRIIGGVGMLMTPNNTSACDVLEPPSDAQCPGDDERCERALSDARRIYYRLINKRIRQFHYPTRGRDANHLRSILELQDALRDAIRRVRLWCATAPTELADWEQAANLFGPGF